MFCWLYRINCDTSKWFILRHLFHDESTTHRHTQTLVEYLLHVPLSLHQKGNWESFQKVWENILNQLKIKINHVIELLSLLLTISPGLQTANTYFVVSVLTSCRARGSQRRKDMRIYVGSPKGTNWKLAYTVHTLMAAICQYHLV